MVKIIALVALVVSFATPCFAASEKASQLPDNLPGALIDEMMKKNNGEGVTAESALPSKTKTPEIAKSESKSDIEATQPVFNNPSAAAAVTKGAEKNLWGRMLGSLAIALIVFGGAVLAYRRWPGSKKIAQRAKMIEILNQQFLGPKKSLAVIRVAGEAVLIGVTDHNITLLKTLSLLDEDIPTETRDARSHLKDGENKKFKSALGAKFKDQTSSREDEFSMQGLKEIIGDRLKNMREI